MKAATAGFHRINRAFILYKLLLLVIFYNFSLTAQWELISSPPIKNDLFKAYRFSDDEWLISTGSEDFLKTEDNFQSFRKIDSGVQGRANEIVFFNDTGYVLKYAPAGPDFNLIKTTDRGESWFSIRNDPLTSMSFINKDTGWVSSGDGIFFTQDGGLTWDTVFNESVDQVLFLNPGRGFSIINNNLFFSFDGGAYWVWANLPADKFIEVYFQDKLRGMIIAEENYHLKIFLTTDGGATYTSSTPPDITPHQLSLKDSTLYLVGGSGFTDRSDDFGATWYQFRLPDYYYYYFDRNLCIGFGYSGQIIKTPDGGKSWRHLGNKPGGEKVQFVDSLNGFTSPWFVTTDGGERWFYKDLPMPEVSFQDYHFFTPLIGLVAFRYALMGTTDGGVTWDTVFYNPENYIKGLYFVDSNNGWMLVYRELVSGVRRTTDGGKTWSDFIDVSLDEFFTRKILFITPKTGFIYNDDEGYGIEGYKTTDGGLTWNDNDFAKVEYMSFIDTAAGFGSGETELLQNIFIKTTDAGNSFNLISSENFFGSNIFFINDLVGWRISYDNGRTFQITYDGGLTWEAEYILPLLTSRVGWNLHGPTLFAGADQLLLYRRSLLSVDVQDKGDPVVYSLEQNYPNPFNPSTTIQFQIPKTSFVSLKVYDILGNETATLLNEEKPAGTFEVKFNPSDMAAGVYIYKLNAGGLTRAMKMILLK